MTKKELRDRIVALEAQVEMLSRQVAQQRPVVIPSSPTYVYPYTAPTYPYTVWSSVTSSATSGTLTFNHRGDDGEPPALTAVS